VRQVPAMHVRDDALTKCALLFAFLGAVVAGLAFQFASNILYWMVWVCLLIAGILFMFRMLVWVISNIGLRQTLLWMPGALALTLSMLLLVHWASHREAKPAAAAKAAPFRLKFTTVVEQREHDAAVKDTLPGYTGHVLAQVGEVPGDSQEYLFESVTPEGSRASFYLANGAHFVFAVTDTQGKTYSVDVPIGDAGIPRGSNTFITCVAGTGSTMTYMRVLADGNEVAWKKLDAPIALGSRVWKSTKPAFEQKNHVLLSSAEDLPPAPWAFSDSILIQTEEIFHNSHPDFFAGDDRLLYEPLKLGSIGPPPISGTFLQKNVPAN
jgi:hypothetical protein